jgi:hypothetical protein
MKIRVVSYKVLVMINVGGVFAGFGKGGMHMRMGGQNREEVSLYLRLGLI